MKKKPEVGILMGSDSDWPLVKEATGTLGAFGVSHEVRVISAHRTPEVAGEYARTAARRGLKVLVAAAGGAAHLAGVVAAHTNLPVIGIPVKGGALNGLDALLATLQMPSGIPVATVTLGSAGPVNAALLAVQILALGRPALARQLAAHKRSLKKKVVKGNARVQADLSRSSLS
jgi:phosphoribosylaminoimidazole carboxylase PurE protein